MSGEDSNRLAPRTGKDTAGWFAGNQDTGPLKECVNYFMLNLREIARFLLFL